MFGSKAMIMVKRKADWTPTMEQRAGLEGRQVKCLIASEGHLWMSITTTGFRERYDGAWPRAPSTSVRPAWMRRRGGKRTSLHCHIFHLTVQIERKLR